MSIVKLPWMSDEEVDALIGPQIICRIAFKGDEYPYLSPFRYVSMRGTLYFHFTDYGKKMRLIKQDDRCCVQIERYAPDLSSYSFVSLRGRLEEVTDPEERKKAVGLFRETGRTLSTRFLAAHGLDPKDGWGAFTVDKDLVIVKLVDVVEKVGLKNP
ncbi:MAG TPA: pyridoxamine 5'-phosphate oxidase family protein [Candidatus Desulfaltia sp.]|nr:pyridoxamine 5'-phosphate oxidase family protein [Candidatus Desulfaltia sp.]